MPQKKNPDVAELARGKSGRLVGNLMALLTTLKGLPLAYDRDLQEDKEPVFDSVEQLLLVLPALAGMVVDAARRRRADDRGRRRPATRWPPTSPSGWCARDVPFRDAHEIAGRLVRLVRRARAASCGRSTTTALAAVDERLTPDVRSVLSVRGALAGRARRHGGTAPAPGRPSSSPRWPTPAHAHAAWATGDALSPAADAARLLRPAGRSRSPATCSGAVGRARAPDGTVAVRLTEVEAYAGERRPRLARLPRPHAAQRR